MKPRILVIDDELGPRESFRMLLKDRYDVQTAASGAEGLARLAESPFDLVFLDVRMPDMDGVQVLRGVREQWPDLPVIMVTAYAAAEVTEEILALGVLDCLIKPFNRRDVERLVQQALNQTS